MGQCGSKPKGSARRSECDAVVLNSLPFAGCFLLFMAVLLILPKKARRYWLLAADILFYLTWERIGLLWLLLSAFSVWACGLGIREKGRKKIFLILPVLWNIGLLVFFKYAGLADPILQRTGLSGLPRFRDLAVPLGLSFYTLRCVSYAADVWRGKLAAEDSFISVLLYVSFFPQIISGPIERPGAFFRELRGFETGQLRNAERIRRGALLFVWGLFEKLVLAERLFMVSTCVFGNFEARGFWELLAASLAYTLQIYCDFAGYSDMSRGIAGIMGFSTERNFRQPYLAAGIKSFWRRWHISLTSWLTDYVYIPLGGSRKGLLRKYANIIIVFLASGLWHGNTLNFIFWGMLHAFYQILENLWSRTGKHLPRPAGRVLTFLSVNFAWIFFNSGGLNRGFRIVRQMLRSFALPVGADFGLSAGNAAVLLAGLAVLLMVDLLHEKGSGIHRRVSALPLPLRWLLYLGLIWAVIMLGIYGVGYDTSNFIYAQF